MTEEKSIEEKQYKSVRTAVITGVIIIGLFAGLFYGGKLVAPLFDKGDKTYNGFEFYEYQGYWVTQIQKRGSNQLYNIEFHYHPDEVKEILIDADLWTKVDLDRAENAYVVVDPDENSQLVIASVEVAKLLGTRYDLYNIPTEGALTRQADPPTDAPIINCNNATNATLVFHVRTGERNAIYAHENCITLEALTPEDSIRVADRLAYNMLGIIVGK